jgi:hypothetical protein
MLLTKFNFISSPGDLDVVHQLAHNGQLAHEGRLVSLCHDINLAQDQLLNK